MDWSWNSLWKTPTNELTPYPSVPLAPIGNDEFIVTGGEMEGSRVNFIPTPAGDGVRFVQLGGRLADRVA